MHVHMRVPVEEGGIDRNVELQQFVEMETKEVDATCDLITVA